MNVVDVSNGASYDTLGAAIGASAAGDVIQIDAGSYVENFPSITHSLTIEAVGGLAYLSNPQPDPPNGRAVIDVPTDANVDLTLAGLDISGAVDDASDPASAGGANGAGVLFETGNGALVVNGCRIHDNEDGVLTGGTDSADPQGLTVTIENSEIDDNGLPATNPRFGYDHNIYVGAAATLTVTGSYIHDALSGNEIKSRATISVVTDNRIFDGPTAEASYEIDLPDGGVGMISRNVIEKGPAAPNENVVHFGGEGTFAGSNLIVNANTLIGDRDGSGAIGVFVQTRDGGADGAAPVTVTNNAFYSLHPMILLQDDDGTGPDVVSSNALVNGAGPTLDTSSPVCFAMGTRIATDRGEIPIEDLAIGDRVITSSGEARPLLWIGRRSYDARSASRNPEILPVLIRAGALAEGMPSRDLRVSPRHGLHLDGMLIPAASLLNGATILQPPCSDRIDYLHIELREHEVLLAEGAPCESYIDLDNRNRFHNALDFHARYPGARGPARECAPRVENGERVVAARGRLAARAVVLGHVAPCCAQATIEATGAMRIVAPADATELRLLSRARRAAGDRRSLGVLMCGIRLDGVPLELNDSRLSRGFHAIERHGEEFVRWTDGEAVLALGPAQRARLIELRIAALSPEQQAS